MKNMTKDRYNTIAARLLLITLLSTFVCVVINSYIPLIITGAAFVGFLVFARKRYGYRAVESRELTKDEIETFKYKKLFNQMYSNFAGNHFNSDDK